MKNHRDHQIGEYLKTVTDEMTFSEAREGARRELRSHIEEHVETALSYGVPENEATNEALRRMGSARDLGISLNKIHQPKFDFILPLLAILLSAVGIWNLSGSRWVGLQTIWIAIGAIMVGVIYFLPVKSFKNLTASSYGVAILGLVLSHFSGVAEDGQPYLSIAGLNIKMVDLAGTLFSMGFPAIDSRIKLSQTFSKNWLSVWRLGLFLMPMIYFSNNGYVWPGLLFLVSGLCYLGMSGISTLSFIGAGVVGSGMLATRFAESVVSIQDLNRAIVANSHTDFALRSMQEAMFAEAVAASLLVVMAMYGIRVAFSIKDFNLRAIALVGITLMTVQIFTSVLANLGLLPMISAGINIPFISYGGSGIIANFLIVGVLVGCLKRKSLSEVV
jgi:cell division protein FtsW (lipid II flippase)